MANAVSNVFSLIYHHYSRIRHFNILFYPRLDRRIAHMASAGSWREPSVGSLTPPTLQGLEVKTEHLEGVLLVLRL